MTHEDIKILISAYIDGEVTPSEKNIVEEHLSSCESCQKDYKMYTAMSSSLSKWSDETLSPDETIKVQKHFEQRREPMITQRMMMTIGTTLALAIIVGSVIQVQYKRVVEGRLKSSADEVDKYSDKAIRASENSILLNTQQQYWGERKNTNPTPIPLPLNPGLAQIQMQSIPNAAPVAMATMRLASNSNVDLGAQARFQSTEAQPYYMRRSLSIIDSSSIADKHLGAGLPGTDAFGYRQRIGEQVISYNYYPQPYPVEPYRVQDAESNTEQYDRIYDNPFLAAKENPLSTFSIDVDTGSYSNIRRFLLNGQKPPKDAVHIEELINYFNYDYPQPTGEGPFSITTEVSTCPWNPQHQLALIGLQGKKIAMENLPPSNLVFLIDVSGSMGEENKLSLVKSSLHLLVEQLRPQDTISIAVFSGSAERLLEATSGREKDKILDVIDNLEAGGSTNGEEGLQLAYKMAKENFILHGNNRIIITTDGDFNVGTSNDGDLVRMIEEKRDEGVYLSVFGFGMGNLKADRMEKLADSGHGNYDYIDSLDEARKEFEQQLGGTLYAIAKDVKIQVEFNPSTVKAYRLIGYEKRLLNKEDFNNDKKDAGVLGNGHTVTALYELTPTSSSESVGNVDDLRYQSTTVNPSNDLMTIKLRYKDPESDTSKLIVHTLNKSQISQEASENMRFAGAVAEFGMLLCDSDYKGNASFLQVMDLAQKSLGTDINGYRKDFLDLIEKAGLMQQYSNGGGEDPGKSYLGPAAAGFSQYYKCPSDGDVINLGDTGTAQGCLAACSAQYQAAGCWWLDGSGGFPRDCRACRTLTPVRESWANDWAQSISK